MNIKRKIIAVLTVLSGISALFTIVFYFLLPIYLSYQLKPKLSGTNKITMIGEADGPTNILIASQTSNLLTLIPIILTVLGTAYLTISKRNMNRKSINK